MAKVNYKGNLQRLLTNELSSTDNDKKQVISAYTSLIDILKVPQIGKQLQGCHELLFTCLSQIILTPFQQYFDDNQLHSLLESASNARVLSMSQNQIIDEWLQNIEDRDFEKPDFDEEDDDDDDLYEDATDSEEEVVVEVVEIKKKTSSKRDDKPQKHVSFQLDSRPVLTKEKSTILKQSPTNQRNTTDTQSNARRNDKNNRVRSSDNKFDVDLQLYECYNCGEKGHIRQDCPKKQLQSTVRDKAPKNSNNTKSNKPSPLNSSGSVKTTEPEQNKLQQIYNQSLRLLNSSQNTDERNQTFESLLSSIDKLQKQYGENLPKIFADKETIFYPLFCHIAQNNFLFTNEQYSKLYQIRTIILPQKQNILDEDRSLFSRQRALVPLKDIREHVKKSSQIQQSSFNDLQEYVIRASAPVLPVLYDLINFILKSNVHIDPKSLEYFTKTILFDMKKDIFSNEQFVELQSALTIRTKRLQRNQQKQIWKDRLNQLKNEQLTVDFNSWIDEFIEILKSNNHETKESSTTVTVFVIDHAMWYFAVLSMSSSGHLNTEQYERLLNAAVQSALFNTVQRFYFQVYLKQGHAPITNQELNLIKKKLENDKNQEKQSAYQQINEILDRQKPEFHQEQVNLSSPDVIDLTQTNNQSNKPEDVIPFIDTYILSRLLSLIETICSDVKTFSSQQCSNLVDKFLYHSSIVRPLSPSDQQRLTKYLSRSITSDELKVSCSSIQSDLIDLIFIMENRILTPNDSILDLLTETIVTIFQNQRKYSNEKCQQLKSLIDKTVYGKKRYKLINETYQKYRSNKVSLPTINRTILNQYLTNILSHDYQTHLDFFSLLEDLIQSMDFNEASIEFEINRCLLSAIILVITETDFSNSSNSDFFRHRLQALIDKQTNFFLSLLTEHQFALIVSRLTATTTTSNADLVINNLKSDSNEKNFLNLIEFIQNDAKEKSDLEKLVNFILYTFDEQILSIEQTIRIVNLVSRHPKLTIKSFQNLLEFLLDLLQQNIRSSPKVYLKLIETKQDTQQIYEQILLLLKLENGKFAIAEWKKTMIQILTILCQRQTNVEQLKTIAQQSPMFKTNAYKQQLEIALGKSSNENPQRKTTDSNEHSVVHRELFRYLESNDSSMNEIVVKQLQTSLINEKLPSEMLIQKFIQALQVIFKNTQKFSQISLDQWSILIEKNRGKIFNDNQCDQLLLNIVFSRIEAPSLTLSSLQNLIQSKKAHERHDGLQKLLRLLRTTSINNENSQRNHLSTLSNHLYNIIMEVIFNEKFKNDQVRQCLTAAKHSVLLDSEYRLQLDQI